MGSNSKLKQHKFNKGLIQTPLNTLDGMKHVSWSKNRLPEYLWLGLILMSFDRKRGLEKVGAILKNISNMVSDLSTPKLSRIFALPQEKQEIIYKIICEVVDKELLSPLTAIYRDNQYEMFNKYFYCQEIKIVDRIHRLSKAINLYYEHQSHEATDLRFCALMLLIYQGNIIFNHDKVKNSLDALLNYAHTNHEDEDMKKYRPFIRSLEMIGNEMQSNDGFINYFWKEISMKEECRPIGIRYPEEKSDKYGDSIDKFKSILNYITKAYKESLLFDHKFDVIVGTATYGLKIFNEVVVHDLGNSIIGRNALRTIIEIYIIIRYLIKIESEHSNIWEEYKVYGIGKYKLPLLKEREGCVNKASHFSSPFVDFIINEIKWEEFLDIDLVYFDRKGIREKSIEVGEKELYDLSYDYDTNFVHGFWGAIRESSMYQCNNASHQYHLIPDISFEINLSDVCEDMQCVVNKIFELVCKVYPVSADKDMK